VVTPATGYECCPSLVLATGKRRSEWHARSRDLTGQMTQTACSAWMGRRASEGAAQPIGIVSIATAAGTSIASSSPALTSTPYASCA